MAFGGSEIILADQGRRVATAAARVLDLRPDLEALLRDLRVEGSGRARCFLEALDELAEVTGHGKTAIDYLLED